MGRRRTKALAIVEGVRTDAFLMECLAKACGMDMDVYPVGGNVYAIYQYLKREGFDANVKDVAAELSHDSRDKAVLQNDFADTFLVFDCDPHHTDNREDAKAEQMGILIRNLNRVREMAEHFNDSTDPTKGKLFVNYPMVESFRDCDDFFDSAYEKTSVAIDQIASYKQRVSARKLCRLHPNAFTQEQFESLCRMNVFKLASVNGWGFQGIGYPRFLDASEPASVAAVEAEISLSTGLMPVLNTSLFLPLDYFGNKDGYYDRVVNGAVGKGDDPPKI